MSSHLLTSVNCEGEVHLVVGISNVAALRINAIIAAGANPVLVSEIDKDKLPSSVIQNIEAGKLRLIQKRFEKEDLQSLGRDDVENVVDKVFVTLRADEDSLKRHIYGECKRLRIPINTSDSPELCTFTLLSAYQSGDFSMGVTTSGKGCRLASRLKREMLKSLPPNVDQICNRVGELRQKIREEDTSYNKKSQEYIDTIGENDDDAITSNINSLVEEFNMSEEEARAQRSRWLSQIVEYYPLKALAEINMNDLVKAYRGTKPSIDPPLKKRKQVRKGIISLVGSGPGSVNLLTIGALQEIHSAELILADKLVPQQVLDLIPQATEVFIARKFPGNAENAQTELLQMGLRALEEGKKVVRLKQGDPYIFGRGGEEFSFFESHGYLPLVLPGITSALAATVVANTPATHRDVADQVLICTGTGRRGAVPNLPEFVKSRTTIFLMALHRAQDLIVKLINEKSWDSDLPCAIIERASCNDQRIIRCNLKNVGKAIEELGSRPPGLLITGYACNILQGQLDQAKGWQVQEGCDDSQVKLVLEFLNLNKSQKLRIY